MTDQFEPAYRSLVVACKSDKRWFDLDAVREVNHPERMDRTDSGEGYWFRDPTHGGDSSGLNPAGAPPLDYWLLDTQDGVDRVLKSMLPERVCRVCGEPSRRIVEHDQETLARGRRIRPFRFRE